MIPVTTSKDSYIIQDRESGLYLRHLLWYFQPFPGDGWTADFARAKRWTRPPNKPLKDTNSLFKHFTNLANNSAWQKHMPSRMDLWIIPITITTTVQVK